MVLIIVFRFGFAFIIGIYFIRMTSGIVSNKLDSQLGRALVLHISGLV